MRYPYEIDFDLEGFTVRDFEGMDGKKHDVRCKFDMNGDLEILEGLPDPDDDEARHLLWALEQYNRYHSPEAD